MSNSLSISYSNMLSFILTHNHHNMVMWLMDRGERALALEYIKEYFTDKEEAQRVINYFMHNDPAEWDAEVVWCTNGYAFSYVNKVNITPEVLKCAFNGDRISAIKALRRDSGLGLKDAKDIVEGIMADNC